LYSLGDKDGRGVDVHRLKTQLKAMGETTLVEKLESAVRATVNTSVDYSRARTPPGPDRSLPSYSDR
jgi:hypothetical protein